MHLSYEKLGTDHKMYSKVDYIVMDGMQAVCYKGKEGYIPLESDGTTKSIVAEDKQQQRASSLFVLSFKINGETEEMTFKSKKKMDKTIAFYKEKEFITDVETAEYKLA
jgi:hypothetical protein